MGRSTEAGWPLNASSVAIHGGARAMTLSPTRGSRLSERQSQHDPRDRAERAGADRLEPRCPTGCSRPPARRRPRSRTARPSPCPSPAPIRPPTRRRRCAAAPSCMRETPRVTVDTPSLQGSINLKGARFDDLVLVTPARDHRPRIRRRSGCCRRPARPAPISPASAGPARASPRPTPTPCGPPARRR